MRTFCDLQGQEVALGKCMGQGGEGAVYSVPNWPLLVAKVYARRPDDASGRKLASMVQLGTDALASIAAWPQNLLLDPRTGAVVGFLMPRVDGHREIHTLYGPTDRKTAFPDATWAFLCRAARNLAAAFDTVHAHGHVIGDVNQGNVVVSPKATVRLIDCDSFQITHLGRTYPCRVGVPLFTPPELQGRKLDGVLRRCDHDRFGLAVLLFQLLFMGRHPFAGRHPDQVIPVETAIREGLFTFGRRGARHGWQPPPFSLRLEDATAPLALLFERAFDTEAASGTPRPSAAEWVASLDDLEAALVTCGDDPRHVHARSSGFCPWCRIELDGGPSFFYLPPGAAPGAFDFETIWRSIEAVTPPGAAPPLRACPPTPTAVEGLSTAALRAVRAVLGLVRARDEAGDAAALAKAEEKRRRLETQWDEMCGDGRFLAKRRELDAARAEFESLAATEGSEWADLAERFRERRLPEHLSTFELEFARIPGLGPGELARLAAHGVKTAADVSAEKLMAIRWIDLGLVRALLLFKGVATRSFRFDPVTGIPGMERKALGESQSRRRQKLVKALQAGALELAEVRRQTLVWRDVLGRAIREAQRELDDLRGRRDAGLPHSA
jgi:DNA-binding helix-hairpin-helix protein with protein kinase domain